MKKIMISWNQAQEKYFLGLEFRPAQVYRSADDTVGVQNKKNLSEPSAVVNRVRERVLVETAKYNSSREQRCWWHPEKEMQKREKEAA